MFGNFKFKIADQEEIALNKAVLGPDNYGRGEAELYNHVSKFPEYKPDEELVITCKIMNLTTDKVVWDTYNDVKVKYDETKTLLDETKATLDETKSKLCVMETKLEELQNVNNNNSKMRKPHCPICFEKMIKNDCPSCGQPVDGRAFGMESYLRTLFGFQ